MSIPVAAGIGSVSGLLALPADAVALFVLAHGAGAGMEHPFLEEIARALAEGGVGTLRYNFPYREAGRRRPDPPERLQQTVRAAVGVARELAPDLPLVAGGKSMGGRMTSLAQSGDPLPGVRGLIFLGFPLHPARRRSRPPQPPPPSTDLYQHPPPSSVSRADHLPTVRVPLLFLQGTRDALADLVLLEPVVRRLDGATLHVVEGGDHSFEVPRSSGRPREDVRRELVTVMRRWVGDLMGEKG